MHHPVRVSGYNILSAFVAKRLERFGYRQGPMIINRVRRGRRDGVCTCRNFEASDNRKRPRDYMILAVDVNKG